MVKVESTRFGTQEIEEGKIIFMPQGMLGFPDQRFILLTPPKLGPFCWFQSVDSPDLAFVVVDAKECVPDNTFALTAEEYRILEFADRSEVIYLLVVTMAPNPRDITVNLQGPIALNAERMIAKQIVIEGAGFTTRHPFFAPDSRAQERKGGEGA